MKNSFLRGTSSSLKLDLNYIFYNSLETVKRIL